jgi:hypothetical protein
MPNIGNTGVFTNVYLRKLEDENTPNVAQNIVMSYDTKSHQVRERGVDFVEATQYLGDGGLLSNISFEQVAATTASIPTKIRFSNTVTGFITDSNVGIANLNPTHTLDIGSSVSIDDLGDDKLTVRGNLAVQGNTVLQGNITVLGDSKLVYANILVVEQPIALFGNNNEQALGYDVGAIYKRDNALSNVAIVYRVPDSSSSGFNEELAICYSNSAITNTEITPDTSNSMNVHIYGNVTSDYYFGDASTLSNITFQQVTRSASGNTTANTVLFSNTVTSLVASSNVGIGVITPHARLDVHNDSHTWTIRIDRADNQDTPIHFREIEIFDIGGLKMPITASRQSNAPGDPGYMASSNAFDGSFTSIVQTAGTDLDWVEFDVVSQVPPGFIRIWNAEGVLKSDLTGCAIIIWDENATEPSVGAPKLPQYYNRPIVEIFEEKQFIIPPTHFQPTTHNYGEVLSNLVTSNIITSTGRLGINGDKVLSITDNPSYVGYSQFHITSRDGGLSARMGVDQSVGPGSIFIQGANNFTSNNINLLLLPNDGNVGIGTLVPQQLLDVDGNIFVNGLITFGNVTRQMVDLYSNTYGIGVQSDTQYYRTPSSFAWFKGGSHHDAQFNPGTNGTAMMVLTQDARVGINTTSPQSQLHVNGDIRIQDEHPTFRFVDTDNTQNAFIQVNSEHMYFGNAYTDGNESNIMTMSLSTSNVGIGVTNPESTLSVYTGIAAQGSRSRALTLKRKNASTQASTNEVEMSLVPNYKNREYAYSRIRSYCHEEVGPSGTDRGAFQIIVHSNEVVGGLPAVTILNKNTVSLVGIGVTQPTANLQVGGDVKIATNAEFGPINRQKISLYDDGYGIGVQTNTQYFRTPGNFAWYKGGTHTDGELNPGTATPLMILKTSGQLGIGTTQPTTGYELDVVGDARIRGHVHLDASAALLNVGDIDATNYSNTYVSFGGGGSVNDWAYLRQIGGDNSINLALDFHDEAGDAGFVIRDVASTGQTPDIITKRLELKRGGNMYIGGNIGVGTEPGVSDRLRVNGDMEMGSSSAIRFRNSTGTKLQLYDAGTGTVNIGMATGELRYNVPSTYNHVFMINNSEKFRINETGDFNITGNVYVGSNDNGLGPKSIYFGGTSGDNGYANTVIENRVFDSQNTASEMLLFKGNNTNDRIRLRAGEIVFDTKANNASRTANSPVMTIKNNGRIGIGTTDPQDQLSITGNLRISALRMRYTANDGIIFDSIGATNRLLTDGYVCTGATNKLLTTGLTATAATVNGDTVITGNVGISTSSTYANKVLHANGDIYIQGNIAQGFSVSIGEQAALTSQNTYAAAIGYRTGYDAQAQFSTAIGTNAGFSAQGIGAIAIGRFAGEISQGRNAIAIGWNAGQSNQHDNTIVMNARTTALNTTRTDATYIKPVRPTTTVSNVLAYTSEGELIDITTVRFNSGGNMTADGTITAGAFVGDAGFMSNIGGNLTNTTYFSNVETSFISASNCGVSNITPIHTLDVGSNLFIEDAGSNVLTVRGNVLAQKLTLGSVSITPTYTLQQITTTGNTTTETTRFTNTGTSLVTSGKVGIKTATPTFDLEVTGTAAKTGGGSWSSTSDRRLKEEIENADLDRCYETVKNLTLRRFKWKDNIENFSEHQRDKRVVGWIAQEVEEVLPKSIETFDEKYGMEDIKFLNTDQIYATMYGALQKAIQKIESLESELKKIKN